MDVRTDGILRRRRQPANHRVANVFGRPVWIVRGHVAGDDSILEPRGLEGGLPIEDRLSNPGLPFVRRVRIHVVDDWLLRVAEITLAAIGALEAEARDVSLRSRDLRVRR